MPTFLEQVFVHSVCIYMYVCVTFLLNLSAYVFICPGLSCTWQILIEFGVKTSKYVLT